MKLEYHFDLDMDGKVTYAEWRREPLNKGAWWGDGYFCTNDCGEGVFYIISKRNSRKQLVGTCDFSVTGCTRAVAQRRIRKWMSYEAGD